MIGWLNLGSLVLGLIALILPSINIARYEKLSKYWITFSIVSLSACSVSLFLQIFSFYERVKAEDWAALTDTMSVIASVHQSSHWHNPIKCNYSVYVSK